MSAHRFQRLFCGPRPVTDVTPPAGSGVADAADALDHVNISDEVNPVPLSLVKLDTGRDVDESTMGGGTTCSLCFVGTKTHLAVPCGHLCVCESCATSLNLKCPICRATASLVMRAYQ